MNYSERLHRIIPSGAHTYSRNQFPDNAPQILKGGRGAYVFDNYGRRYLDYGMGLRAVSCGYAEESICSAALDGILMGNCMPRPSMIELDAAELMVKLIPSFDMVKFTKTGSAATTAAVKLARAYTGKIMVATSTHPFFSYDDWFIGGTSRHKGCRAYQRKQFKDTAELEYLMSCHDFACVIMEPDGYDLKAVQKLCNDNGVVFILDEMITGFRYRLGAATDVMPDLSCFGKAMANGFSVACLGGKREIMELGAHDDMFLLSTTHGAEMCGLAAFMATVKFMQENKVIWKTTNYGGQFKHMMQSCANEAGVKDFSIEGHSTNPHYKFSDDYYKTLFQQELCKHGVLMPWCAFSFAHGNEEMDITKKAVMAAMKVVAMDKDRTKLEGRIIKPVFA